MTTSVHTPTQAESATSERLQLGTWIFSADDHLLETSCDFTARVPRRFRDQVPSVVDHEGGDAWLIEGTPVPITIADGSASWPVEERPGIARRGRNLELVGSIGAADDGNEHMATAEERINRNRVRVAEDFRAGVFEVDARIADMTADGVWASVLIPSMTFGFAGQRFSMFGDPAAGLAAIRAYNDWLHEDVMASSADRLVGSQVLWLQDPAIAAGDIRGNAMRGFTAALFPENPERFGFPSIHSGHWDPIFDACEETGTVLNVHLGTGLKAVQVSTDSPLPVAKATLAANPIYSVFDWVFSGVPQRFPGIQIALTEGGIDWVPLVYGRLDTFGVDVLDGYWKGELAPTEILLRNFYFTALFDIGAYDFLLKRCPTHLMIETDYPHGDSLWPRSQEHFATRLRGMNAADLQRVAAENAAALYRRTLPPR